jgi:hypothetical protein
MCLLRSGYTLLLFFTAASIGDPAPFQAPGDSPDRVASIHGIVTNAVTGAGLRKAYLRLASIGRGAAYPVTTNDQGAFAIENIAPGNYRLDAECTGFLDTWYGGGTERDEAVELRLSAGRSLTGIEIKMTPQAVLSGRVLDQDGDPWPHANISVFHSVWKKGHRHIESAEWTGPPQVDDLGEFRVAGFAPGRYYVFAEPDEMWEEQHHPDVNDQPAIRQQPTWYPSSPDAESSTPITLAAGQQLSGVDIRLRRGTGSKLRIRGKLLGRENVPTPSGDPRAVGQQVLARRVFTAVEEDSYGGGIGAIRSDGTFEINFLPSGTYDVWVKQGFPSSSILGHATVQVDSRDVENVSIELHPPQTLHVIVRIEGDGATNPPQIPIYLEPVDFPGIEPLPIPKEDGSLEFRELGLGLYRVNTPGLAHLQMYLKLVRYGDAESSDGTFTLSSYGVPLELVFSTHGARLSGTLTGKATAPQVILIPETPDGARREHGTRAAVFDQNGVFSIESIAPGSYKLYAFESVPEGIWLDPDFLKEVEGTGVAFEAAEGDAKTIQTSLLGKQETDRVLAKLGID